MNVKLKESSSEKKYRCAECNRPVYDPLIAIISDLRLSSVYCEKCLRKKIVQ